MRLFLLTLSSGTEVYTDDAGRELVLGLKQQGSSKFVSVNFYGGPSSNTPATVVDVNRDEVAMISSV